LEKIAVPDNLAAIIDHYIAKLSSDQRLVLSAAAVYGVDFHIDPSPDALQRDADVVGQKCDDLTREQVWLNAPRLEESEITADVTYSFRHALFRQVLYERTAPAARAQLHRKLAVALERDRGTAVPVTAAELATHFERGREPAAALRYYAEAAEKALSHFSSEACRSITERASPLLQQVPDGSERA